MFEKEAEIYALSNYGFRGKNSQRVLTAKIDWQKGAEFGFQKGIKAKINTTTISDCPIKDEWHFVKDGDLPKENIYLVIRLNDENTCYKYCTGFWEKEEKCFHTLFCSNVDIKDIVAWKKNCIAKGE